MSLDLAPDASEESGYVTLHLSNRLSFVLLLLAALSPALSSTTFILPFPFFYKLNFFLKSVDHPEVGGQTWGA